MFLLKLLSAPVIGAIIGYCTNWIAVKMLFRPREPKYIGKFRIPLTPGVIPKGKERLAGALEKITNEQLLTRETMLKRLLSDEVLDMVDMAAISIVDDIKNDPEMSVKDLITSKMDEYEFNSSVDRIRESIVSRALARIDDADLGQTVSDAAVRELYKEMNSLPGFLRMLSDSLLPSAGPKIKEYVDNYIDNNAESMIRRIVQDETEGLLDTGAADVILKIEDAGYDMGGVAVDLYKQAVDKNIDSVLAAINAGEVVRSTINDMDNKQIEELVLMAMKNELGAVVNFGAIIGFVIGIINMLIYLI